VSYFSFFLFCGSFQLARDSNEAKEKTLGIHAVYFWDAPKEVTGAYFRKPPA
jgi:hypothetical protein